jgi:hypothetical protein
MKLFALRDSTSGSKAFTLIEVLIASAMFFIAIFAILEVISFHLRAIRLVQVNRPDPGMLAAELSLTNRLEEGTEMGDFGELYPNHTWQRDIAYRSTNGLYQVTFTVFKDGESVPETTMDLLLFRPESGQFQRPNRNR